MTQTILLLADQSEHESELYQAVQHLGYRAVFVNSEMSITAAMLQAPILTLAHLEATSFDCIRLIRYIKGPAKKNNHVPVVGFAAKIDATLETEALAAGCTAVVNQSKIEGSLATLIEEHRWALDEAICGKPLPTLAQQGIAEFNQGLYFECHETLEDVWNAHEGLIRVFYQGILQIAVGYLHIRRHNWRGAVKVLERGIPKTAHFQPTCQTVDVADLVIRAQEMHTKLIELGPDRIAEFDHIDLPTVKLLA